MNLKEITVSEITNIVCSLSSVVPSSKPSGESMYTKVTSGERMYPKVTADTWKKKDQRIGPGSNGEGQDTGDLKEMTGEMGSVGFH